MSLASQQVYVVHGARLRLPDLNLRIVARVRCERGVVARSIGATAGRHPHPPRPTYVFRHLGDCPEGNRLSVADFWRRRMEAGGVEPPSEKRYGPKTTCLA